MHLVPRFPKVGGDSSNWSHIGWLCLRISGVMPVRDPQLLRNEQHPCEGRCEYVCGINFQLPLAH